MRKSLLGWVVFGIKSQKPSSETKQVLHVRFAPPVDISEFWKTESMGVAVSPCTCEAAKMSPLERAEMKIIEEACTLEDSKWTVEYPWKRDPTELPDNYAQVVSKMESMERRLKPCQKLQQPNTGDGRHEVFKKTVKEGNRGVGWTPPLYFSPCNRAS